MDWNMILKMSVSVLLYVLLTAVLTRLYRDKKPLTTGLKILIGLVFGICSAVASHLGTQYPDMPILHVQDLGPLCAGLLFSPLSGIIAGFIGGAERLLAGGRAGRGKRLTAGNKTREPLRKRFPGFYVTVLSPDAVILSPVRGARPPSFPWRERGSALSARGSCSRRWTGWGRAGP